MAKTSVKTIESVPVSCLPLQIFLLIAPFCAGLFFEYLACAAALFLIGYLLYVARCRRSLTVPKSLTLLAATVVVLCMLLGVFWAVDHGMAIFGFVKFLPLPLFVLSIAQLSAEQQHKLLQTVPLSGVAMTVIAYGLHFVPGLASFFLVNSRLAGFFQYPNVYALFLLLGVILIVDQQNWKIPQIVGLLVLLFGIFQTGSRTTFILLLAAVIALSIVSKDKTTRLILLGTTASLIVATVIYAVCTGNVSAIGRYLTTSLHSSTFLGRLLYDKDALPVIITHPFGLGYGGYASLQGSFQTGVYSVAHIHNELLQLFLDVGWLPALLAVFALVRSFVRSSSTTRILLAVTAAHCLMDFDLQFPALGFILVLVMVQAESSVPFKTLQKSAPAIGTALAAICLYFGLVSGIYYAGAPQTAVKLYPGYTVAWQQLLLSAQDEEAMDRAADKILSSNDSSSIAYSAKARIAFAAGDFGTMITYKEKAISLAKYSLNEYLDYFSMLQVGIQLYTRNYDSDSADYCRKKLLSIPDMLSKVEQQTSSLAWKLDDKPDLTLPLEYQQALLEMGYQPK